ncbi:aminoglycoside phosphotransferase family protein [Leptothrix sp. BB-4]
MNIPWQHRDGDDPDAPAPADFPQRRWCFGSAWLDGGLARALGRAPVRAEVDNVHHLPGRQLQVVYRLEGAGDERVTLRFEPAAAAGTDADSTAVRACGSGRWLAPARAWAWCWPDDPGGLPLADWLSPAQIRSVLPPGQAAAWPSAAPLRAELLSYSPAERLALRWRAGPVEPGWVMKAQRTGMADATTLQRLWHSPSRRWVMAEPLAEAPRSPHPEPGTIALRWERFLPGERLEEAAARDGWTRVLQQAATALVALHRQPLDGLERLPRFGIAEAHAQLDRKVMRRIEATLPGLADRSRALADRLGRQAVRLASRRPAPAALLHGDLHTGNLLRGADGRIAFIDLDSLRVGDPAWDLAMLSTRLMLIGLVDPGRAHDLAGPLTAWPQTCLDAGADPQLLPRYHWHVATMLLSRQVKTCVRHHAPGLTRLATALLEQAEAVAAALD